ncbi:4-hydroxy-tetrahydrodipicolinate synthase [Pseudomonas frederiksbergensis]|jgi:4-hydroxy-tetrahydrodipicolinate synthase|uniref:4-hydroxy-tetrahydrodipicolinate synthase n=1 Tax=Pseudomonas TaxID=286 RepID=UPI000DACC72D|nr:MULTISPECIES: 4-hydroxy-tetrahydrodipicolinate synthase [unclassified Pseudomonas]MBD9619280.1 4-hydroxy-tetrahydrodipicolinate synthase [Pseudomonas sp. PDM07]PZW63935.1 4-hydroxy-tetrahydrodipicolinate synthase [Pseudomonas sp. URMO17WK12:I6]QDV96171.1 4-hydroxy-tetrahydrodipicolinate synthase [Pseudomonas sp. ATCC 43928]WLG47426.1 4-hydroxy-tetrahydrodipicolinate synthase [Pseudomonas sp. FP1740]CAH0316754.1 4-hydroxy-tetrahydrodipicolinate synthase [Pseudomonas sp. Bi130]
MQQLKGILPALVTPFDQSGAIDYDVLTSIIEYQLKQGVSGFVPLGSTGEYYALTNDERRQVMATVREVVGDRGMLIAGANGSCTREVIEQVKQARDIGYRNLLIAPPYYAIPTQEELIGHYEAILDAVPDVNIVLYNYPIRTNVEVGYSVLDALKDHERVIGIKESAGNLLRAVEIGENYKGKIQLSCGSDDQALDFFLWGATSWICAPANFLSPHIVSFYNKYTSGDLAGAQQIVRSLFPLMANLESGKFIQKVKYGCELAGFEVGVARMPLLPLTAEEKTEFRKEFEKLQG